ncbi:RNA methyltransferase, partial [Bacteroides thetaiotaomicron]|nr:RNA methyltransferase [Bacteroides thetaiotaomicron]
MEPPQNTAAPSEPGAASSRPPSGGFTSTRFVLVEPSH